MVWIGKSTWQARRNSLQSYIAPFRPLLSMIAVFQRWSEHDLAFLEAKSRLLSAPELTYLTVDQKTIPDTDAYYGKIETLSLTSQLTKAYVL